jgi:uncharacterized protein YprB with RNaseH-like and TPR domain
VAKKWENLNFKCNSCALALSAISQSDIGKTDWGFNTPSVLFVYPANVDSIENSQLKFLQYMMNSDKIDIPQTGGMSISRCLLPLGISDKERKKYMRSCFKCNILRLIQKLDPGIVVILGEETASIFPKVILQECRANKFSHMYRSIKPDRLFFVLEDASLIMQKLEENDVSYLETYKKTLKCIAEVANNNTKRKPTNYTLVNSISRLVNVYAEIMEQPLLAVDIETSGLNPFFTNARVVTISFSWKEQQGVCFPVYHSESPFNEEELEMVLEALKNILGNDSVKIFHNGKFDVQYIQQTMKMEVKNFDIDTMLAHYACYSDLRGGHDLKRLALQYTDLGDYDEGLTDYITHNDLKESGYAKVPLSVLWPYNCCDTDATLRLWNLFKLDLIKKDRERLFKHLMQISKTCIIIEKNGFLLDFDLLKELEDTMPIELEKMYAKFIACKSVELVRRVFQEKEKTKVEALGPLKSRKKSKDGVVESPRSRKVKVIEFSLKSTAHLRCLLWEVLQLQRFIDLDDIFNFLTDKGLKECTSSMVGWSSWKELPINFLSTDAGVLDFLTSLPLEKLSEEEQDLLNLCGACSFFMVISRWINTCNKQCTRNIHRKAFLLEA